jgi:hypothetical protein
MRVRKLQRVHLSCFDEDGNGWLTEGQLKEYLRQLIPELPGLHSLGQHMEFENYVTLASRKFVMLHSRNGRQAWQSIFCHLCG